jgi:hypothetical protein
MTMINTKVESTAQQNVADYSSLFELRENDPYIRLTDEELFELEGLDDEDYNAGWNMTKAEVLGFDNFEDCYSTFDGDDYDTVQAAYEFAG